jgi:hypothetical protein
MYYIEFDSNGNHIFSGISKPEDETRVVYTVPELGQYKLVDNEPVLLTEDEIEEKQINLTTLQNERIVRDQRNQLLASTDYTQVADTALSATDVQSYKTYRQALRDITTSKGFPNEVVWPALSVSKA